MLDENLLAANIITLLGLEALPEEKKTAFLKKMSDLIQRRIMLRVVNALENEDQEKMAALEKKPDELLAFISEKVPNMAEIMRDEIIGVKKDLMQGAVGV